MPKTAADDRDDEAAVHKVDTVPPPDGEGDAYSAETKVGPVSQDAWADLIRKANEEGERNAASAPASRPFPRPSNEPPSSRSGAEASVGPPSGVSPKVSSIDAPIPRFYTDDDEDDNDEAATVLSAAARPDLPIAPARTLKRETPSVPRPAVPRPASLPTSLTGTTPSAVAMPSELAARMEASLSASSAPLASTPAPTPAPPPMSLAPSGPASVPPSNATTPSARTSTSPRPLAFLPGDPALPPHPMTSAHSNRALVVIVSLCLTLFVVGLALYLWR